MSLRKPAANTALFLGVLLGGCMGAGGAAKTGGAGVGAGAAGASAGAGGGGTGGGAAEGPDAACSQPATEAGAPADAGPEALTADCEACQRAHAEHDRCPATLLTATHTEDPSTGDQVPVGWGLSTLATQAERDAGGALLSCLNRHRCATDAMNLCSGDNPTLGCFCGPGVDPVACIAGDGVHGPCLAEYKAAAVATPGGPPAGASLAAISLFVTMKAYDSTGPVGLADMINRCAIAAGCEACFGL